jgi:hypothetical protein
MEKKRVNGKESMPSAVPEFRQWLMANEVNTGSTDQYNYLPYELKKKRKRKKRKLGL